MFDIQINNMWTEERNQNIEKFDSRELGTVRLYVWGHFWKILQHIDNFLNV